MRYRFRKSDIGKTFLVYVLDHTENEDKKDRLGLAEVRGRLESFDKVQIVLAAWRWPFDLDDRDNSTRYTLKRTGIEYVVEMAPVGRLPKVERDSTGVTLFNP